MTKEQETLQEREVEFLQEIHQAAQMGRDTLEHVNNNIGAGELRNAVEKDIFDYSDICAQAKRKLCERDAEVKSVGKIPKFMAGMMIDVKVNEETPDNEIAKMIIDGTTKGITDCTQKLSDFTDINEDIKNIGYKFLWIQQKNVDDMKPFLHSRFSA